MVFERAKGIVRRVTLELVYEVVDERTKEIIHRIEELERKREEDFKYLNQKIDTQTNQLRQEMGQLRQEISQLNQKIDASQQQLNQRIDTVIQMLSEILRSRD